MFLIKLFIFGWTIRVLVCLSVYIALLLHGGDGSLFNDDAGWPRIAWLICQSWLGNFNFSEFQEKAMFAHSLNAREHYLLLISLLFCFFKYYTPLVAKYVSIIFGCLTAIVIYDLSKQIFNQKIAKICSILTMFTPSLIVWSTVALKDAMFIFLVVTLFWTLLRFLKLKKWYFIPILALLVFSIYSIRAFFLPLVLIPIAISAIIYWRTILLRKVIFLFVGIVFTCALIMFLTGNKEFKFEDGLNNLKSVHVGFVQTGGAVYKLFDDRFYTGNCFVTDMTSNDLLKWYLKGVTYFTFVPIPWGITSKMQLMYMPQLVVWYVLFPFILVGIIFSLRFRTREIFPIVIFICLVTSIYGLTEGNIGTVVRHRDVLTPFYLIFASAGLRKVFGYPT